MSEHAKTVEPKIRAIQEALNKITPHTEELLGIIYRPGWTTPRELEFVHAMLDSLAHQIEGVDHAHQALVAVANKIGHP